MLFLTLTGIPKGSVPTVEEKQQLKDKKKETDKFSKWSTLFGRYMSDGIAKKKWFKKKPNADELKKMYEEGCKLIEPMRRQAKDEKYGRRREQLGPLTVYNEIHSEKSKRKKDKEGGSGSKRKRVVSKKKKKTQTDKKGSKAKKQKQKGK